jgi:hypothetical protein
MRLLRAIESLKKLVTALRFAVPGVMHAFLIVFFVCWCCYVHIIMHTLYIHYICIIYILCV